MNIALLTAGGIGNRMKQDIPKQFMIIQEKPVIVYTMEVFQNHPEIDIIAVVCLSGWEQNLQAYAKKYKIDKLKCIFSGGKTNQESIYNGISGLQKNGYSYDDIVLVHDGVRPLVSNKIITDNINICKKYGYAVTGIPCKEVIMGVDNELLYSINISRECLVRTQTPHTYHLGDLVKAYEKAKNLKICDTIAPCDMFAKIGEREQHLVIGTEKNSLKLTIAEDIDIFRSILQINSI